MEQQITEKDNKRNILSTYSVTIHKDKAGHVIITKNPTLDSKPQKSDYQPKQIESDGILDAVMTEEINSFLETSFKLDPTATEKELAYYVSNNDLSAANKNYVSVELVNPVYTMPNNQETVIIVTVKYLDQETKMTQFLQFELTLQKQENCKITK